MARASAAQSVVDQLQAQLDAFRTGGPAAALRGDDASDALSVGMDMFEIISGAGDDSIRVQASNATVDAGAGNDVIAGGAGDDVLLGGPGQDVLDGGPGDNIVIQG